MITDAEAARLDAIALVIYRALHVPKECRLVIQGRAAATAALEAATQADATPSTAAAVSAPEGNDSDDGFFCDGCSAVIQEAAAWIGNSAYCKDCVGRLCESYFKDGTKPRRKRAQHAHPPSASPQSAPEGLDDAINKLSRVYAAARSLCFGADWNRGSTALYHGCRQQLIDAVHAVEPLPDCACRPTQADAIPLRAAPSAPPEGNDAHRTWSERGWRVDLFPDGAVVVARNADGTVVEHFANPIALAKLAYRDASPQADAAAHPPSASPQSAPEGKP